MVLWFCVVLQFCFSLLSPVCPSFFLALLNAKKYHVPLYQSVSKGGPTVIKSAADSPATSWLSIKGQLLLLHSPEELMFFALWSIKVSISPAVVGPFMPRVRDLSGVLDFIRVEEMRLMDCKQASSPANTGVMPFSTGSVATRPDVGNLHPVGRVERHGHSRIVRDRIGWQLLRLELTPRADFHLGSELCLLVSGPRPYVA